MAPAPQESLFSTLEIPQYDEVFGLMAQFVADTSPQKVSLGAGVYRDNEAKSWRLNIVRKVEKQLCEDPTFDHEYLPIEGYQPFVDAARDLVFGNSCPIAKGRIASLQTVSGTGANHLGARFLKEHLPRLISPSSSSATPTRKIWLSDPTWANHHLIWDLVASSSTGSPIKTVLYPYYHAQTRSFDFDGMIRTLEANAQRGDVILLHACAHNPTGLDPTRAQWEAIASLCQRKGIFPFFDSAYQGFASGDLDNDAWAMREFVARGMEMCVAQSFSKNLGLYGQRVGAFHLVCHTEDSARRARFQLIELQRGEISMPPAYEEDQAPGGGISFFLAGLGGGVIFGVTTNNVKYVAGAFDAVNITGPIPACLLFRQRRSFQGCNACLQTGNNIRNPYLISTIGVLSVKCGTGLIGIIDIKQTRPFGFGGVWGVG
ncbi:aspartate aminotransferase [Histoplasma capsulatum H143]|uniref:Aspartate aminotransferase n=1 Tax=Ajellomyces capsulatus (strain H143) TaxID=544712 RepID=C6HJN1_AJECH|nr:aspartate aminotransferase [Histoplasma capsulatum H143]